MRTSLPRGEIELRYAQAPAPIGELLRRAALRRDLDLGGAVALLIFFASALQCMPTVAATRRETGGWKSPALQFGYMLLLAWVGAWTANALL